MLAFIGSALTLGVMYVMSNSESLEFIIEAHCRLLSMLFFTASNLTQKNFLIRNRTPKFNLFGSRSGIWTVAKEMISVTDVFGAVRGVLSRSAVGRRDRLFCYYTGWKHQVFRVACSERVHCENSFRMDGSFSSFATKSWACVYMAFVAGIISL